MLAVGSNVAGYVVEGVLGRGGMGVVYEARQLSLDRLVALKVLSHEFSEDVAFRRRFQREGQIQAAVDHPHIVTVHEAGEIPEGLFIAMRLIRGPTLKNVILGHELGVDRVLRILAPIADAIDFAHDAGLVHRDIKPQNILVGSRDHAYLADFGLTKVAHQSSLTDTGQFVGTINYIAPEQIRGEPARGPSDIYSLAAVIYECLVGDVPFPRMSEAAVLFAHVSERPPSLSATRPDLPQAVDRVIAHGMAKRPADRPTTAGQLIDDLRDALTDGPAPEPSSRHRAAGHASTTAPRPSPRTNGTGPVPARDGGRSVATSELSHPTLEVPTRRRGLPLGAILALAVFALAAATGRLMETSVLHGSTIPGLVNTASSADLALSFPPGWHRVSRAPTIEGLGLKHVLALAPHSKGDVGLVAGETTATGRALLPRAFLARLARTPDRDDTVRLGRLAAYRYGTLAPRGFLGQVTVFVVPTTAGTATIACYGPADADAARRECERIAGSLRLRRGRPFELGANAAYAAGVRDALLRLSAARRRERSALSGARHGDGQAKFARRLRHAYRSAAGTIAGLTVSPADKAVNASLVTVLKQTGAEYGRLAIAARKGKESTYRTAAAQIRRDEGSLQRTLAALRQLGYRLG